MLYLRMCLRASNDVSATLDLIQAMCSYICGKRIAETCHCILMNSGNLTEFVNFFLRFWLCNEVTQDCFSH
jgi:hypothetical protein